MFLQACVILFTGGGMHFSRGACIVPRGCVVLRGACFKGGCAWFPEGAWFLGGACFPGGGSWGACMVPRGHAWFSGGVHASWGVCASWGMRGVHASRGGACIGCDKIQSMNILNKLIFCPKCYGLFSFTNDERKGI